jgi:serine/threonine protein kinase
MFEIIREIGLLKTYIANYFTASLILAIEHLHGLNIIYRDLKPENSVVCHNGKVVLIDLGTAKELGGNGSNRTFTIIGTPHYMAP